MRVDGWIWLVACAVWSLAVLCEVLRRLIDGSFARGFACGFERGFTAGRGTGTVVTTWAQCPPPDNVPIVETRVGEGDDAARW